MHGPASLLTATSSLPWPAGAEHETSIAVQAGGKGDVFESHKVWQGSVVSSIATPVIHDGKLYVVNDKVVSTVDLSSGRRLAQARLSGGSASSGGSDRGGREQGGGGRSGGGRGGYGGMGGRDYSSPIIAGNHLYYSARSGDTFVFDLGDEIKQVARNKFESDRGEYNATPAVSDGDLFIRSTTAIYCIAATK